MLNRRLLRIKAMQSLYAAIQTDRALQDAAKDNITAQFAHDLNSMEVYNASLQEGNRKLATLLFDENYKAGKVIVTELTSAEVLEAASNAVSFYLVNLKKDQEHIRKQMLLQAEAVNTLYLKVLSLITYLPGYISELAQERAASRIHPEQTPLYELKFLNSAYVSALQNNLAFNAAVTRNNANWEGQETIIRKLFRDFILNDEIYCWYIALPEAHAPDEQKFIRHLIKNIILKNDLVNDIFEEQDLYWTENHEIVQSMVLKTMKNIEENGSNFLLMELSKDWEDDKRFFEQLYRQTLLLADEFEALIAEKSKNWDTSRLALTDKIIIIMALTEMVGFPNIPVKVSLNEYIEISKEYSTPQSRQYVNGLLDTLSEQLITLGRIKKSGRGLIDNK
jgi:transcription antitermination protein NusB